MNKKSKKGYGPSAIPALLRLESIRVVHAVQSPGESPNSATYMLLKLYAPHHFPDVRARARAGALALALASGIWLCWRSLHAYCTVVHYPKWLE